ncbi:MAG: hypothetical protein AB7O68_08195 [Pirellulales bacterium]
MSLRKTIDGSSLTGGWAALAGTQLASNGSNSGSASGNRFSVASSGGPNWTFRALTDADLAHPILAGTDANGYLESTVGQQCYLQVEAQGTACPNTGDDYYLRFRFRGSLTGAALPGDDGKNWCGIVTSSNTLIWNWLLNNGSAPGAPGFGFSCAPGGSVGGSATNLWDTNGTKSPLMTFGQWHEATIHFHRAASTSGYAELFINGRKVSTITGSDTDSVITWSAQNLYVLFPQWSGVQWSVTDFEAWDGTDIVITPLYDADANQPVTKILMPAFANADSNSPNGLDWQWNGAGLALSTEYANSTGSERRRIFTCTSGTPVATTCHNLGALPYNEQGWATLVFPDFSIPGGSVTIALKNAANNVNLMRFVLAYSTTIDAYMLDSAGNASYLLTGLTAAVRYSLLIHLNRDGRATWTILDRTTSLVSTRGAWSGPLPDWTPQTLGKCSLSFIFNTTAIDFGSLIVASRPTIALLDSISTTNYATPNPDIRIPYTCGGAWATLEERQCLPGGYWNHREDGLNRRHITTTCGQGGLTRRSWSLNMMQQLAYTRGCEFLCFDGGAINDIFASTVTPTGNPTTQINACKRSLSEMFDLLLAGDNAIWMSTVLKRNRRATVTAIDDNGSGKCRITAASHGVPVDTYYPRITGGTGIAGIDNSPGLDVITSSITTNTFDVDVNYSTPSLVAPVVEPLSTNQETFRQAVNAHIRYLVRAKQRAGLVRLSDIDADMAANPSTYPNTLSSTGMWSDVVHPQTWLPTQAYGQGSWIVTKRMVATGIMPATPRRPRRWPRRLVAGRG